MTNDRPKPGYKQTAIGLIPEDWEVATTEQVCELVVDCKNRTPPFVDSSEFAVVRTPNVRDGRFVYEDLRFTDEESFHEWTARAVPKAGDILITREAPLGEVCLVPTEIKVCLGQRMMLYRPDLTEADNIFLLYSLMAPAVQNCLLKKIGGSTVGHAKVNDIRTLAVPLPPLPEQRSISQALSDVDRLIAALEKAIAKKRHLKIATMQQLLTGKKRLPGFGEGKGYQQTEVGSIPEDWQVCYLEDLTSAPITYGVLKPGDYFPNGIPLLQIKDVIHGEIDIQELHRIGKQLDSQYSRTRLFGGEIVVSLVGTIGKIAYIPDSLAGANLHRNLAKISLSPSNSSKFIFYQLESGYVQQAIKLTTFGSTQSLLNLADLRTLLIITPSLPEQTAIATVLFDMDTEIAALETRLAKTQSIKQGMMQQLLTGKVRLKIEVSMNAGREDD